MENIRAEIELIDIACDGSTERNIVLMVFGYTKQRRSYTIKEIAHNLKLPPARIGQVVAKAIDKINRLAT